MTALVRYETAKSALAEARSVDEVKDIRDKAEAVRAYARMANDTELEADAAELRLRAERRMGILLADMKARGELHAGGRPKTGSAEEPVSKVRLSDLDVDKKLSVRCQRVGGIAERAFEAMIARTRQRIADGAGRLINIDADTESKKLRRAQRERELAERQRALPERRYGVIYADPEWKHVPWSETGMRKAADNHYPTQATDEICKRPVGEIAEQDCVLFLWATVPMLPDALRVMAAWSFKYRSHAVWRKIYPGKQQGMGYWFRINHELLLIGTRGTIPCPAPGENWGSVFEEPVGKHSAKPDRFYELIEAYFPNLPKIELNARRERLGWDAWGNESPQPTDAVGEAIDHDPETGEIIDGERYSIADGREEGTEAQEIQSDGAPDIRRSGTCGQAGAAGEESGGREVIAPATVTAATAGEIEEIPAFLRRGDAACPVEGR
ncbi:MAG: hypothetical protein GEU91_18600 [Rhizobiales bacterium]|nr:hypothetical protein [Hyphomicrobiales bacterium]